MKNIVLLFLFFIIGCNSIPNNCEKLWTNYNNNQEVTLYMCKQNITQTTTQQPTTTTQQPTTTTSSNIPSWFYDYLASQGWSPPSNNVETNNPTTTKPITTTKIITTTSLPTTTTQQPTTTTKEYLTTTKMPTTTPTQQPTTTKTITTTIPKTATTTRPTTSTISPVNPDKQQNNSNIDYSKSKKYLIDENNEKDKVIKNELLIIIILGIVCGVLLTSITTLIICYKCKCKCCEKKEPISPGNVTLKIKEKHEKHDIETGLTKDKIKDLEPFKGKDFDILRKQSMDRKQSKKHINKEGSDILKPKLPCPPNGPPPNGPPPNLQDAKKNFRKISKRLSNKNRNSWALPNHPQLGNMSKLPPIVPKSEKKINIKEINNPENLQNIKQSNVPTLHADVALDPKDKHMEFLLQEE
uniref:Uncharacterized protein n=1 Tax=viral metagenome TaxID=1070528 RepID=A0A6C0CPK1_9ZZZZ